MAPEKVSAWVANPGPVGMEISALIGQYVLPPAVKAAMFRYLAGQPGMKLNPDAVNLDGRPAIGLGRIDAHHVRLARQQKSLPECVFGLCTGGSVEIADNFRPLIIGDTV